MISVIEWLEIKPEATETWTSANGWKACEELNKVQVSKKCYCRYSKQQKQTQTLLNYGEKIALLNYWSRASTTNTGYRLLGVLKDVLITLL